MNKFLVGLVLLGFYVPQAQAELYRPSRGQGAMGELERTIIRNSDCTWVNRAGEKSEDTRTVIGYPVLNCQSSYYQGTQIVCTGTIKCKGSIPSPAGNSFTFFVENAMCGSQSADGCPTASRCLEEGGSLAEMREGDAKTIPGGTKYTPPKKRVTHETDPTKGNY